MIEISPLHPIADNVAQSRFHAFIQLIEQVGQVVFQAACHAAPVHVPSRPLKRQRLAALRANE